MALLFIQIGVYKMPDNDKNRIQPPEIGPFVFPTLLALFGLWCFYDGWLSANPEMGKYLLLNRIGSIILLPWAAIDFIRTWKNNKTDKIITANNESGNESNPKS